MTLATERVMYFLDCREDHFAAADSRTPSATTLCHFASLVNKYSCDGVLAIHESPGAFQIPAVLVQVHGDDRKQPSNGIHQGNG